MGDGSTTNFAEDGIVVLRAAFDAEEAAFLREMLWHHIESTTPVRFDQAETWRFDGHLGLRAVEERSIWHPVHNSPVVVAELDHIFGAGCWSVGGVRRTCW